MHVLALVSYLHTIFPHLAQGWRQQRRRNRRAAHVVSLFAPWHPHRHPGILFNETVASKQTKGHDVALCNAADAAVFYDSNDGGDVTIDEFEAGLQALGKCCMPFLSAACSDPTITKADKVKSCVQRFFTNGATNLKTNTLMDELARLGDTTYYPNCKRVHRPMMSGAEGEQEQASPKVSVTSLTGQITIAHAGHTQTGVNRNHAMHMLDNSAKRLVGAAESIKTLAGAKGSFVTMNVKSHPNEPEELFLFSPNRQFPVLLPSASVRSSFLFHGTQSPTLLTALQPTVSECLSSVCNSPPPRLTMATQACTWISSRRIFPSAGRSPSCQRSTTSRSPSRAATPSVRMTRYPILCSVNHHAVHTEKCSLDLTHPFDSHENVHVRKCSV